MSVSLFDYCSDTFRCLEKLCDIPQSALAEVTDLMICAPWARQTFSCLANGVDHTACCKARGLPALCQELCSGNITQLDFNYFKWVYTSQQIYIKLMFTQYVIITVFMKSQNSRIITYKHSEYFITRSFDLKIAYTEFSVGVGSVRISAI